MIKVECLMFNERKRIMKKNYNCPAIEVMNIQAMTALCESQFGDFYIGGGSGNIDPDTDGL